MACGSPEEVNETKRENRLTEETSEGCQGDLKISTMTTRYQSFCQQIREKLMMMMMMMMMSQSISQCLSSSEKKKEKVDD